MINSGKLPKTVLFDLDDTILATSEGADEGMAVVAKRFTSILVDMGYDLTQERLHNAIREYRTWFWSDELRNREGRLNLRDALYENFHGGLEMLGIIAPEVVEQMARAWTDARWATVKAFPGAKEVLWSLKSRGVRLGLVTNGSAEVQRKKIDCLNLHDIFDHIQIEGVFGLGKPEPEVYIHALHVLDSEPEETWMVGDNLEFDVLAPMKLGIYGVWVDQEGRDLPSDMQTYPDRIIGSVAELL